MSALTVADLPKPTEPITITFGFVRCPCGVELERVEEEPGEPAGHVGAHQHAPLAEAGVGVERVHRAQVRHRRAVPLHRQARTRRPAGRPVSSLHAAAGRAAGGLVRGVGGPRRTGAAAGRGGPGHGQLPDRTDRPTGSDATHPSAWRAASGRRSSIDWAAACSTRPAGVVERVEVVGGDGDDADVAELGMALGQLAFAALDVGLAAPLAGGEPEPVTLLLCVIGLDRGQLPVGVGRGSGQRHRLQHDRHRAGRPVDGEQRSQPVGGHRQHRPGGHPIRAVHGAVDPGVEPVRLDRHRPPLQRPPPDRRGQRPAQHVAAGGPGSGPSAAGSRSTAPAATAAARPAGRPTPAGPPAAAPRRPAASIAAASGAVRRGRRTRRRSTVTVTSTSWAIVTGACSSSSSS